MRVERGQIVLHQHLVHTADGPVPLTPIERQLLQYLAERPHQVVPLEEILEAVWGYAPTSRSQAVHVAIRRLRKKLEVDPSAPRHLKTVAGAGWMWEPLPTDPEPALIGRDLDRRRLLTALAEAHRVCLTGPPGVGKTALARAIGQAPVLNPGESAAPASEGADPAIRHGGARGPDGAAARAPGGDPADRHGPGGDSAAPSGPGGGSGAAGRPPRAGQAGPRPVVVGAFVDLAGAADLDEALARVARELRCSVGQLPDRLASSAQVVVLDQAEGLAVELAGWLDQAPGSLRCLLTSRLPIRGARRVALDPLDPESARALFHRRSAEVGRDTTGAADQPAVDELVRFLDGNPLAIELAAARSRLFAPGVLLSEIRRNPLPALEQGDRSMLATLGWSWDLLEARQRENLVRLAAFQGPFDLEAAGAVLDDPERVGAALGELLDHGLLRVDGGRFALLQLVRAFVRRAAAPEALAEARARHARWFARAGEVGSLGALHGPASAEALAAATADLRAAAAWSIEVGDLGAAASLALAWAGGAAAGGGGEALAQHVARALALAEAQADGSPVEPRPPGPRPGPWTPDDLGKLEIAGAAARSSRGAGAEALAGARRAAAVAVDRQLRALILTLLAPLEALAGERDRAAAAADEAVRCARASGVEGLVVGASNAAALVAERAGDAARALDRLTEACAALEVAGGHPGLRARLDANRASFLDGVGRAAEARAVWASTLPTLDEIDPDGAAVIRNNLAYGLWEEGRLEEAAQLARFALQVHRTRGVRTLQAAPLSLLGRIARREGRHEEARRQLGAALTLARECEQEHTLVVVLVELAELELAEGRPESAEPLLTEASARAGTPEDRALVQAALERLREVEADRHG